MVQAVRLLSGLNMATFSDGEYGLVENGAIAIKDNQLAWVGTLEDIPEHYLKAAVKNEHLQGRWVTPGLIDCHTHIIYAGNRAHEFEQRLSGVTYEDIAKQGGGIHYTVAQTRKASERELYEQSLPRIKQLISEGVTTLEIKSGYGLDKDTEIKLLRLARKVGRELPVTIKTSFLGAHLKPKEFDSPDAYIDFLCQQVMPELVNEGLADFVDGFCETIAFSAEQLKRYFFTAKELGLPIKLHTEQLSRQQGAQLAAEFHAVSVEHLEYLDEQGIDALAKSGTVAVLLPGAYYFLKETQPPPVQALQQAGVPIAIATDSNPGSSPVCSLLLMLNMATTFFGLKPVDALRGVTVNAAKALGLQDTKGQLKAGMDADLVIWDIEHPRDLVYRIGSNPCYQIIQNGIFI